MVASTISVGENASRSSKRISYAHFLAAKNEQEISIDDDLGNAQKQLGEAKALISVQSKKNFTLEKDVRYLDGRIALLIQNRMALDEKDAKDIASLVEESEELAHRAKVDDKRLRMYSNLFFLLQTEPKFIATLCRLATMAEIDSLLQTVMFTLYGNQYDSREEYLLLSMFQAVLTHQFDTADNFGSLMRANSPVSRMMTTYTRRGPGQNYLKTLLSTRIGSLIKHKDLNLEINPLKVYEQILDQLDPTQNAKESSNIPSVFTVDDAAKVPEVKEIILLRINTLCEIGDSFLNTIIDSLENVPYGIRWICKQIKGLTKRKYPDATDSEICSLIGGFFMLRYVNPAVVTPQAFMLIPSPPEQHPRRTLTLIAKMLQHLANGTTQSKENYMQPLTDWAKSQQERIVQFFLDLCEVPDFYEDLELDQYVALSKKEMAISITINELYGTQALLWSHRDVVAPNLSHVRVILNELGVPPPQLPRAENRAYQLELYSRWETDIADTDDLIKSSEANPAEIMFLEAKTLCVQILRTCPQLYTRSLDLVQVLEKARLVKDNDIVKASQRTHSLLMQLESLNVVTRRDGYRIITEEVQNEMKSLHTLKERIQAETESLKVVYKAICEHNDYLRAQLDTYRSYLQNVRMKTTGTTTKSVSSPMISPSSSSLFSSMSALSLSPVPSPTSLSSRTPSSNGLSDKLKKKSKKHTSPQSIRFSHSTLEKDGVIVTSAVPEQRKSNLSLNIVSSIPGTFVLTLEYKGRDRPILQLDLQLDDLLERQQDGIQTLSMEFVQLSVPKLVTLLNKHFMDKS